MAQAAGQTWAGGFEQAVINDENGEEYTILYLPDRNNDLLQKEGKPPVYYWVPGQVRLAQFGGTGDYKFRHIHFVGIMDESTTVGVSEPTEVVGGLLSFTTTSRYPTSVLKQAEEQILEKFRGDNDKYWGWRTQAAPMFRIAEIRSNVTAITNLTPGADGTAPAENIPTGANGLTPEDLDRSERSLVTRADVNQPVVHGRANTESSLDAWAWELQGQGPGSVTGGENAYAGLIGAFPSELVWAGFHGGASPIVVTQNLMLPVWSQEIYLKITGNWDSIFQHFSAHANASYLWFSADIKAEFNKLRISGGVKVEISIDGTLPGADSIEKEIDKRIDLIVAEFMKQANERIFKPAPPSVTPAKAPSGGVLSKVFGGNAGVALSYRRDSTKLNLEYEETRYYRYLQPTTISSSFRGFHNVIKNNPEEEKKYFIRHELGDLSRKVRTIVKGVVNWPDPSKSWVGDPVSFMSVQVGYPTMEGSILWKSHIFQSTDKDTNTSWISDHVRKEIQEITSPPDNWNPDDVYIKRKIHLTEPGGQTDNPFVITDVEENVIELDPVEGSRVTDAIVEVRADSVGKLEVGPIDLDVNLQDNTQVVTVELKAEGTKKDGSERGAIRFQYNHDDQTEPRYWEIFTGQLDYMPVYKYRVHVDVKGSIFTPGMAWVGPWSEAQGNGALMVRVPRPDEEGVVSRKYTPRELVAGRLLAPISDSESDAGTGITAPPGSTGNGISTSPPPPPGVNVPREVSEKETGMKTVSGFKLEGSVDVPHC